MIVHKSQLSTNAIIATNINKEDVHPSAIGICDL